MSTDRAAELRKLIEEYGAKCTERALDPDCRMWCDLDITLLLGRIDEILAQLTDLP